MAQTTTWYDALCSYRETKPVPKKETNNMAQTQIWYLVVDCYNQLAVGTVNIERETKKYVVAPLREGWTSPERWSKDECFPTLEQAREKARKLLERQEYSAQYRAKEIANTKARLDRTNEGNVKPAHDFNTLFDPGVPVMMANAAVTA